MRKEYQYITLSYPYFWDTFPLEVSSLEALWHYNNEPRMTKTSLFGEANSRSNDKKEILFSDKHKGNNQQPILLNKIQENAQAYFATCAISYVLFFMSELSSYDNFSISPSWYALDALGGIIYLYGAAKNLQNAKANHTRKTIFFILDAIMCARFAASTMIASLAHYGVIHGALAHALVVGIGSIGCSALMWIMTVRAAIDLKRAYWKSNPLNLLENRIDKIKTLEKNIEELTLNKNGDRREAKITTLNIEKTTMLMQAKALAKVCYQSEKYKNTAQLSILQNTLSAYLTKINQDNNIKCAPSHEDEWLVKTLLAKQHHKVENRAFSLLAWSLASIGMTLAAVAITVPVLAPFLIIPAAIFLGAVAVLKLVELTKNSIIPAIAKWQQQKEIRKNIILEKSKCVGNVPTVLNDINLTAEQRTQCKLAYELKNQASDEPINEAKFYDELAHLNGFALYRLLESAMDKTVENKLMQLALQANKKENVPHKNETSCFSEKHKKQLVSQYCNNNLSFFNKKQKTIEKNSLNKNSSISPNLSFRCKPLTI